MRCQLYSTEFDQVSRSGGSNEILRESGGGIWEKKQKVNLKQVVRNHV